MVAEAGTGRGCSGDLYEAGGSEDLDNIGGGGAWTWLTTGEAKTF